MIPKMCIEAIIDILDLLFGSIAAAPIPNSVTNYLGLGLSYISSGLTFLAAYVDLAYILSLVAVVAAIDGALWLYKISMWIFKKIPFWGVK